MYVYVGSDLELFTNLYASVTTLCKLWKQLSEELKPWKI